MQVIYSNILSHCYVYAYEESVKKNLDFFAYG